MTKIAYSTKAGDSHDGQPEPGTVESSLVKQIIEDQLKQDGTDGGEYGYPRTRWHHYWGYMDGQIQILTRRPDAEHPANTRVDAWKSAPPGVTPSSGSETWDPYNN